MAAQTQYPLHLLILGAPRSGTTLLACMIAAHRDVAMLREDIGMAIRKLVSKRVVGNKLCVPNQIEMEKKSFPARRLFKKMGLIRNYPSSSYSLRDYLALPNLKIIAIIRNGDDVVSSNMGRGKKSFRTASYRWRRAIEIIYDLKREREEDVMVLPFEELVTHPGDVMRGIAGYLGLDFEDGMLEGYKYNKKYREAGINKEKANRHRNENLSFDLASRFPAACRMYEELLSRCRKSVRAGEP